MSLKIGILTMQWANNYGGLLQCYALSSYLSNKGFEVEVVNYWPLYALQKRANSIGKDKVVSEFGEVAVRLKADRMVRKRKPEKVVQLDEFRNTQLRLTEPITDLRMLKNRLAGYDVVIAGSDQIWNPNITGRRFDDAYFINFDIEGIKVAYAPSTGIDLPERLKPRFNRLIDGFDYLSAREISLSEELNSYGKSAPAVLDPVFLLDPEKWRELLVSPQIKSDYILVYSLEYNKEMIVAANDLHKKTGLPLVVIGTRNLYTNVIEYASAVSVERFLGLIANAKYVITNSFHGTAFSLIFKKSFIVFPHSTKPARMIELLKRAGLTDRIAYNAKQASTVSLQDDSIDYAVADMNINKHVSESQLFLADALKATPIKKKVVNRYLCSGCGTCSLVCPKEAISLSMHDGFIRPAIDKEKCINCGLCQSVCPHKKAEVKTHKGPYAFINSDDNVRRDSSSGGFFSSIAKYVIDKGGVVYGVAYKNNLSGASYVRCTDEQMIRACMGSKYIQADTTDSFKSVGVDLQNNKIVLYTGTPCCISALISYLKHSHIDHENLITADIICHGIPSNEVFGNFIRFLERKYSQSIDRFYFRDKSNGWRGSCYKSVLADGRTVCNDFYSRAWNKLFALSMNDVCFQCTYAQTDRVADFTMGDYWGIEKSDCSDMDDNKGVSLVLCNTEKAMGILKEFESVNEVFPTSLDYCHKNNPLFRPTFKPAGYDAFWGDIRAGDFDSFMDHYCYYKGIRRIKEWTKWFLLSKINIRILMNSTRRRPLCKKDIDS